MADLAFDAIGTNWQISLLKERDVERLEKPVRDLIDDFDKTYSRFRDDSLVSQMSRKVGEYELPDTAAPLLNLYKELYVVSDGVITPLIGNTISDLGYDANYSLVEASKIRRPDAWEEVLEYSHPNLKIKRPAMLDFGAAGKGYLVDLVAQLLKESGFDSFTIDASGDIYHENPLEEVIKIGLEHPGNSEQAIGVVELANASLCGSAKNRRVWGKYHHIVDPVNLSSPREILSTWVVADSAMLADALATSLFLVPAIELQEKFKFEYAMIKEDYVLERSDAFPAEFFF